MSPLHHVVHQDETQKGLTMSKPNEFDGDKCARCGDTLDSQYSQLQPVWSDDDDDIVCQTCFETNEH